MNLSPGRHAGHKDKQKKSRENKTCTNKAHTHTIQTTMGWNRMGICFWEFHFGIRTHTYMESSGYRPTHIYIYTSVKLSSSLFFFYLLKWGLLLLPYSKPIPLFFSELFLLDPPKPPPNTHTHTPSLLLLLLLFRLHWEKKKKKKTFCVG